tara:strand:- start:134 stop:436 length:303 start_codon:yes stop_codon:yes gene_type:complete
MSAIFDALKNLPELKPKKHFVMIDGNEIEVTLEKKLEIMRHGEDKYMVEDSKVVLKPIPKIKSKFKKLIESEKGYYFVDNNIHWPEKVAEGGKTWQIEYE